MIEAADGWYGGDLKRFLSAPMMIAALAPSVGCEEVCATLAETVNPRVVQIAATDAVTMALLSDGTLRCWGDVQGAQCGRAGFHPKEPAELEVTCAT